MDTRCSPLAADQLNCCERRHCLQLAVPTATLLGQATLLRLGDYHVVALIRQDPNV